MDIHADEQCMLCALGEGMSDMVLQGSSMQFKGKVAPWWYVTGGLCFVMTASTGVLACTSLSTGSVPAAILCFCITGVMLLFDALVIDSCVRNHVTLFEDHLTVRFSVFTETIPYSSIRSIQETNNPLASLSASLDRLCIRYQTYEEVFISVQDKEGFLAEMHERNPSIPIERKLKKARVHEKSAAESGRQ
jgi:hypothetical protein